MARLRSLCLAALCALTATPAPAPAPAPAQPVPLPVLAKDLLGPCQDADNDARDGFLSELECIGFIAGFVAALEVSDGPPLCLPDTNREDAIRRAYVRWVHASFSKRAKLPVGVALKAALDESFGCE
ncbi:MAG: hypothetical protein CSA74_01190 [Rhodobacterales bacterium]|nr:MAG: hypothetical protein CSA74_01190 [Rhodobacterales bacterium]